MVHFKVWIKGVVLDEFLISELGLFNLGVGAADRGEPVPHFAHCGRRPLHLAQYGAVLGVHAKATQSELLAGFRCVLSEEYSC